MAKYGDCALQAVNLVRKSGLPAPEAWEQATAEAFGVGTSGQEKGCPRDAFLALCQEGKIRGVPKGQYTRSKKNARYAISALRILQHQPALADSPNRLWDLVIRPEVKVHNHQMHVVTALWRAGLIEPA